ncbi:hypothetical protein [Kordia sp.]|uniref:hypothetical protein n=1 Tax=Kordia sp. TaxID=1965332 RepID=UPI003D2BE940
MIRHIEPSEHMRMRPKLYFKTLFKEKTLDSLPLEIIQYAIDQKSAVITVNLYTDEFSVEFNVGMSFEVYQDYLEDITQAEATLVKIPKSVPLWKKSAQEAGFGELIGLIRINATSEWCKLLTYSNGQKGAFLFKEGVTQTRTICGSNEKENYTKITVKPDATIFPNLVVNPTTLQEKIDVIKEKLSGLDIQLHIN